MILDYRQHGERNAKFTALCREIIEERLARAEADEAGTALEHHHALQGSVRIQLAHAGNNVALIPDCQ